MHVCHSADISQNFTLKETGRNRKKKKVCLFSQFADIDIHQGSFLLGLKALRKVLWESADMT